MYYNKIPGISFCTFQGWILKLKLGWATVLVSVVRAALQSIDQENQKVLLSWHAERGLGHVPRKKIKLYVCSATEFEDIFKNIGVIFAVLATHIYYLTCM